MCVPVLIERRFGYIEQRHVCDLGRLGFDNIRLSRSVINLKFLLSSDSSAI